MTRIFDRHSLQGPVTRAFVIGVGAYPFAQDPNPLVEELSGVPENASSAEGAAHFTRWLISNADRLEPPLASIDLLMRAVRDVGPPRQEIDTFFWKSWIQGPADATDPRSDGTVDPPTSALVSEAGKRWLKDLKDRPGSHAIFYGSGHGTNLPGKSMLLLQDLNENQGDPWAPHFDVSHHALALGQVPEIGRATLFLDACAEDLDVLRRMSPGNGVRLENYYARLPVERKIYCLTAAAAPSLTFEGDVPGSPGRKVGRFTQCLVEALSGAAIRLLNGIDQWGVPPESLERTVADLYSLRDDWLDDPPLEPKVIEAPVELWPIVRPCPPVMIPFCINIAPQIDTPNWALSIYDREDPIAGTCLHHRPAGAFARWIVRVPANSIRYALVAERADPPQRRVMPILPSQALFQLRVP